MRHLRTDTVTLWLVVAMVLALSVPALAQGAGSGAAAPGERTLERKLVEPDKSDAAGPVPYNILDDADEDLFLSLAGWSSKYRMAPDIQDGDWVKYESLGDGPRETLEIRATKTADGGIWIVETTTVDGGGTTELHMLFSPGKPKLMQAFRVAADGTREDLTPLDDISSGELFLEARTMVVDELGGIRQEIKVYDSGDVQKLEGPFGSLLCRSIEVRLADDVDPLSLEPRRRWIPEGTLLWLNQDVPRLMPMSAVLLPSLLSPDDFQSVWGGLVRSPYHVLVDYRGKS